MYANRTINDLVGRVHDYSPDELETMLDQVQADQSWLTSENDRILRVIGRYGLRHDEDCTNEAEEGEGPCDCGLEACLLHLPNPDRPAGMSRESGLAPRTRDGACVLCGSH